MPRLPPDKKKDRYLDFASAAYLPPQAAPGNEPLSRLVRRIKLAEEGGMRLDGELFASLFTAGELRFLLAGHGLHAVASALVPKHKLVAAALTLFGVREGATSQNVSWGAKSSAPSYAGATSSYEEANHWAAAPDLDAAGFVDSDEAEVCLSQSSEASVGSSMAPPTSELGLRLRAQAPLSTTATDLISASAAAADRLSELKKHADLEAKGGVRAPAARRRAATKREHVVHTGTQVGSLCHSHWVVCSFAGSSGCADASIIGEDSRSPGQVLDSVFTAVSASAMASTVPTGEIAPEPVQAMSDTATACEYASPSFAASSEMTWLEPVSPSIGSPAEEPGVAPSIAALPPPPPPPQLPLMPKCAEATDSADAGASSFSGILAHAIRVRDEAQARRLAWEAALAPSVHGTATNEGASGDFSAVGHKRRRPCGSEANDIEEAKSAGLSSQAEAVGVDCYNILNASERALAFAPASIPSLVAAPRTSLPLPRLHVVVRRHSHAANTLLKADSTLWPPRLSEPHALAPPARPQVG